MLPLGGQPRDLGRHLGGITSVLYSCAIIGRHGCACSLAGYDAKAQQKT